MLVKDPKQINQSTDTYMQVKRLFIYKNAIINCVECVLKLHQIAPLHIYEAPSDAYQPL